MICPKCKAEYRRGFTECADCGVALVEPAELLEGSAVNSERAAAPGDPNEDPFCSFWKGTDLRVCTEICTVLDEEGIPHKTIRRQDHLFNLNNQSPYEVGVPASMYEKAELAIKDAFGTDAEGAEDAVYESEEAKLLPEQANHVVDAGILSPLMNVAKSKGRELLREIKNGNGYDEVANEASADLQETEEESAPPRMKDLEKIYSEDATARVWDGEDQSTKEMLAMSLREIDIFCARGRTKRKTRDFRDAGE
jgi:hypothetical protein